MINFTNMYIITFVHYIGIFFSVPCKHEMCKYKYIQPCSAYTDLIPDHKPSQLGMYSSVGDKEESSKRI